MNTFLGVLLFSLSTKLVGEIWTKASRKQSCELFLAMTEVWSKAYIYTSTFALRNARNESLLLRQLKDITMMSFFIISLHSKGEIYAVLKMHAITLHEPSFEAGARSCKWTYSLRYQANLSFSAKIKDIILMSFFIFSIRSKGEIYAVLQLHAITLHEPSFEAGARSCK